MRNARVISLITLALLTGCATGPEINLGKDNPALSAGKTAQAQGDLPLAITKYREAIREDSDDCQAYISLGFALLDSNSTDEAMQTFERAVEKFPRSSAAHRGKGAVLLVLDRPEEALDEYNTALQLNPQDHKALSGMGIAYDIMGDYQKAQANFRGALELDSMNRDYENNLALSLALSGELDEALSILERLAKSPDATPKIRQNLALGYGLKGDIQKAKVVGRKDLDDRAIKNNIAYFEAVKSLPSGNGQVSGLIPLNQSKRPYDSGRSFQD